MPHVDEGTLHALLDGELGAAEVLEVQTHFATCSACAARLDEARQMLAETERLVAALEPPSGGGPARAPRFVVGRPMIPLDPVVLIPHNPTPTEVRRSRFKVMAWAASFLVIVGAGFLGLEVRNGLHGSRKSGALRIRPEEFTFAHGKDADSAAPRAAPVSKADTSAPAANGSPVKPESAAGPRLALETRPATSPPDKTAPSQKPPAQPPSPPAPGKATTPQPAAKLAAPVAAGAAAPAQRNEVASERPAPAAQEADEAKTAGDQTATPSRNAPAENVTTSVDRAQADKATADLDREQMRIRAAAATAELDRQREQDRAAEEEARRQEAVQPAAAQPTAPTIDQKARLSRRIGLDEAARQLGGPLHAIDGMTRQLVGLVSPQLVPGADSMRPVVRAVYVDRTGRTLYLDQQRARPGQLDLPFTPQVGPNGLSWMAGSVLLVLQSDLPQDSLRALARRVR
jgi:anti-sigma factor RsiW